MSSLGTSPSRIVPGSISELIENYYRLIFPTLAEATRTSRRGILENFRRQHGDKRVAHLQREHIIAIVNDKAKTPHAANNLRKMLRHLLERRRSENDRGRSSAADQKAIKDRQRRIPHVDRS